jgi:hypothetical protein
MIQSVVIPFEPVKKAPKISRRSREKLCKTAIKIYKVYRKSRDKLDSEKIREILR